MGREPSKLLLTGGGDCEEVKKFYVGVRPRSFINIVEAGKFPAAFGQFKNEANRCVFPVVWSFLKRAVDLIPPGRILFAVQRFPKHCAALASPLKISS